MTNTQTASRPISAIVIYSTSGELPRDGEFTGFADCGAVNTLQSFTHVFADTTHHNTATTAAHSQRKLSVRLKKQQRSTQLVVTQ